MRQGVQIPNSNAGWKSGGQEKSEGRNPKAEGRPKSEIRSWIQRIEQTRTFEYSPRSLALGFFRTAAFFGFRISDFGFPSAFASCFLDLARNGFNFHTKETKVTKARGHLNRRVPSSIFVALVSFCSKRMHPLVVATQVRVSDFGFLSDFGFPISEFL